MKYGFMVIATNLVSIVCVAAATFMAYKQVPGWGWFLFVGAIAITTLSVKNKEQYEYCSIG